jgi:hypothetical protein
MKGLDIARDFFLSRGLPFLTAQFPDLAGRAAAGRILGSDVLGADDEISHDHDWARSSICFSLRAITQRAVSSYPKQ